MKRVLVIEDDRWFADHIGRMLETEYDVIYASNPLSAIDVLDEQKIDVIVVDILLTVSNALALLHELQSHDDLARIPVIVCTTLARDLSLGQLQPVGVVALLDKTNMKPLDILESVRRYI